MAGRMPVFIGVALGVIFTFGCGQREIHLSSVKASAPAVYCLFDPSCAVTIIDSSDTPIPLPAQGTGFLRSRVFAGKPGTAAAGLYGYEYRIDLEKAVETTVDVEGVATKRMPCLRSMTFEFGPVVDTLDYNGDKKTGDLIYVVTKGGPGKVGLEHAHRWTNKMIFYFDSPICVGAAGGQGDSTLFFGLVSAQPPRSVTATLKETDDLSVTGSRHKSSPAYDVLTLAPQASTAHGKD